MTSWLFSWNIPFPLNVDVLCWCKCWYWCMSQSRMMMESVSPCQLSSNCHWYWYIAQPTQRTQNISKIFRQRLVYNLPWQMSLACPCLVKLSWKLWWNLGYKITISAHLPMLLATKHFRVYQVQICSSCYITWHYFCDLFYAVDKQDQNKIQKS